MLIEVIASPLALFRHCFCKRDYDTNVPMKKYLTILFCFASQAAFAQKFEQYVDCDVRVKERTEVSGVCPDKTRLSVFDEQFTHHDKLGFGDSVFSYKMEVSDRNDDTGYERIELSGSSNARSIYLIYTIDDHHPEMNGYKIWLGKNIADTKNKKNACYYTCNARLTPIKK